MSWKILSLLRYAPFVTATLGSVVALSTIETALGASPPTPLAFSVIYDKFQWAEGPYLNATLLDVKGTLYGFTQGNGNNGASPPGEIFSLTPIITQGKITYAKNVLYGFCQQVNCGDGALPLFGGLILGDGGVLYGVTRKGGTKCNEDPAGCGVVFALTPKTTNTGTTWKYAVLYRFQGGVDGYYPYGSLLLDSKGALYGATYNGGPATSSCGGLSGCGTIYKLTPPTKSGAPWTKQVLHSFGVVIGDGENPEGSLVWGSDGGLYGSSWGGGTGNKGIVFRLAPPTGNSTSWSERVIYSFSGLGSPSGDGAYPNPIVFGPNGAIFGTTVLGGSSSNCQCGTVFQLGPPTKGVWPNDQVLYSFGNSGAQDGARPEWAVTFRDGSIFGTTVNGGNGNGTIFQLTPKTANGHTTWTESYLHLFQGSSDGAYPYSALTLDPNGTLFGTASQGGLNNGGVVFELH